VAKAPSVVAPNRYAKAGRNSDKKFPGMTKDQKSTARFYRRDLARSIKDLRSVRLRNPSANQKAFNAKFGTKGYALGLKQTYRNARREGGIVKKSTTIRVARLSRILKGGKARSGGGRGRVYLRNAKGQYAGSR
jgi:hypothetical protein